MNRFLKVIGKVRALSRLGIKNVLRVAAYRARLAAGWRLHDPSEPCPPGQVFVDTSSNQRQQGPVELLLFGWLPHRVEVSPDWHVNPLDPSRRLDSCLDWTDALQALNGWDAKPFWELSRFGWVPQGALAARNGDVLTLQQLNMWVVDWIQKNPPYRGINWSCGQEAAIRIMNLAMAQIILGNGPLPTPTLAWLMEASARRIRPTINYALGQDNNHGSAEACALFISGTWGKLWNMPDADDFASFGRRWLENRMLRLIQPDGSPCQYSTTYQRANLETFCIAELWRRYFDLEPFPYDITERISHGTRWLYNITDPTNGDAPNLGANDGSHLFNFPQTLYRDFRPTVSLAARLFDGAQAYSDFSFSDRRADLFDLPSATKEWSRPVGSIYDDGGYAVLRREKAMVLLRYPRFKFRPSHADALHLDLWVDGENLLRDAGTYSYNTDAEWLAYFPGTVSHNTVQFDDRDQMPRLSRFLFGDWLKTESLQPLVELAEETTFGAAYRDKQGARHQRFVRLMNDRVIVRDEVAGFVEKAVLRWRVKPGDWRLEGQCISNGNHVLTLNSSVLPTRIELVSGWESRYYMQKNPVPVLEIEVHEPTVLTTEYRWTL